MNRSLRLWEGSFLFAVLKSITIVFRPLTFSRLTTENSKRLKRSSLSTNSSFSNGFESDSSFFEEAAAGAFLLPAAVSLGERELSLAGSALGAGRLKDAE